jgi:hypothetical protein
MDNQNLEFLKWLCNKTKDFRFILGERLPGIKERYSYCVVYNNQQFWENYFLLESLVLPCLYDSAIYEIITSDNKHDIRQDKDGIRCLMFGGSKRQSFAYCDYSNCQIKTKQASLHWVKNLLDSKQIKGVE